MRNEDILTRMTPIFRDVFNDPEMIVSLDLTSHDIPDWSSITMSILVTKIEREFGIVFKIREVAMIDGVASIIHIINAKADHSGLLK